MNPYLARLRTLNSKKGIPKQLPKLPKPGFGSFGSDQGTPFFENVGQLGRSLSALEAQCPALVPQERWRAAVADAKAFLAGWGKQRTARDLFGLHAPSARPHPSYSRLSRYDHIGLVWLLEGRPVVALTDTAAAIGNPAGVITMYRRALPKRPPTDARWQLKRRVVLRDPHGQAPGKP